MLIIRRRLDPPEELLNLPCLWPEVDAHLPGLELVCSNMPFREAPWSKFMIVESLAALRRNFLQDVALLHLHDPACPVWAMVPELFENPVFLDWQKRLVAFVKDQMKKRLETTAVETAQPEVARAIRTSYAQVAEHMDELKQKIEENERKAGKRHDLSMNEIYRLQQMVTHGFSGVMQVRQALTSIMLHIQPAVFSLFR